MSKLALSFLAILAILAVFCEARSVKRNYVMELLVVVDEPARNQWIKLAGGKRKYNQELFSTFVEVNEVFKTLSDFGVDLEIRVKKVLSPDRKCLGMTSKGNVNSSVAITKAGEFLNGLKIKFDHAIVLIGADIRENGNCISGTTRTQETCTKNSFSVVQAKYDYNTALTIVKLLAQSLNVDYDGQGRGRKCDAATGYIMTLFGSVPDSEYRWSFSCCSARQIKNYVRFKDCLTVKETKAKKLTGYKRFGQLVCEKETCRRATGKKVVSGYEDQMCSQLYCLEKTVGRRTYMVPVEPPQGLECEPGKMCIRGSCRPKN